MSSELGAHRPKLAWFSRKRWRGVWTPGWTNGLIFIDGEAKSGGKLLLCFLGRRLKCRWSGGFEAFRKPAFSLSGNGIGLRWPSCQGVRSRRGMVMASQGTKGLLQKKKSQIMSQVLEVYIFEVVLKARGCMLLMLSPLSHVTWGS